MRPKIVIWVELNEEQDELARELGKDCVSIQGSTPDDERERLHDLWVNTDIPVMVTKPKIFGHGLNWQLCSRVIFVGVSHSFEQWYQAVRRCWRFGQTRPVDVHVISSELEGRVVENLKDKQRKADELSEETRHYVSKYVREAVTSLGRQTIAYEANEPVKWPEWLRSEL